MQRECLKCHHVHTTAIGGDLEACPQCGAIYSRVEAIAASRGADSILPAGQRAAHHKAVHPALAHARPIDVHGFAATLRTESLYPTFRGLVRIGHLFGLVLTGMSAIMAIMALFAYEGVARFGGFIGFGIATVFVYVFTRLMTELSLMFADLSDASVRTAANAEQRP